MMIVSVLDLTIDARSRCALAMWLRNAGAFLYIHDLASAFALSSPQPVFTSKLHKTQITLSRKTDKQSEYLLLNYLAVVGGSLTDHNNSMTHWLLWKSVKVDPSPRVNLTQSS